MTNLVRIAENGSVVFEPSAVVFPIITGLIAAVIGGGVVLFVIWEGTRRVEREIREGKWD